MTRWAALLCAAGLVYATTLPAHVGTVWLAVADRDASAAALLARMPQQRGGDSPPDLIVAARDCGDRQSAYLRVIALVPTQPAAAQALRRLSLEQGVDYAGYAPAPSVRACDVRAASLLARHISVLDPSLIGLNADALNWGEDDRVSALHPLQNGRALLLTRYRSAVPNDPLQGRRVRVSLLGLADTHDAPVVLREQCPAAAHIDERYGNVAFQCVGEQAGAQLLHTVHVYDRDGRALAEVARCRNPRWAARDVVRCDGERVDAAGHLHLTPRRIPVALAASVR